MTPRVIRKLLPQKDFKTLARYVAAISLARRGQPYDDDYMRHTSGETPALVALHERLTRRVRRLVGKKIKRSFAFVGMYGERARVRRHTDRSHCTYNLDLCVDQSAPWPLVVGGKRYVLDPNDALLFSGTGTPHSRPAIGKGNHCHMVVFHFVEAGDDRPICYNPPR